MTVCHWDINGYSKGNNSIEPLNTYRGHTSIVEVRRSLRFARLLTTDLWILTLVLAPNLLARTLHGTTSTTTSLHRAETTDNS